jgi:hypothetical protein
MAEGCCFLAWLLAFSVFMLVFQVGVGKWLGLAVQRGESGWGWRYGEGKVVGVGCTLRGKWLGLAVRRGKGNFEKRWVGERERAVASWPEACSCWCSRWGVGGVGRGVGIGAWSQGYLADV